MKRTYRENTPEDAPEKERRTTTAMILTAFRNYAILIDHNPVGHGGGRNLVGNASRKRNVCWSLRTVVAATVHAPDGTSEKKDSDFPDGSNVTSATR